MGRQNAIDGKYKSGQDSLPNASKEEHRQAFQPLAGEKLEHNGEPGPNSKQSEHYVKGDVHRRCHLLLRSFQD